MANVLPYTQNKGSLVPGQTITVNTYTVQVERYLSQGGFAHVYLVRTPTPVYNTTHHVLKRIAVANEAMLTEVRKEVDIMRLLKGHPNIVHFIDAAWHKLPNGQYEVFILMEYCPGGGIIDMMNRRLRERLTEAEILQIFIDVLEGVAFMHNSRPPLLHRDLKVENILQSSSTSFKLCDFGSAATVTPTPTTSQEIRALEADLNRHTTLQYRAPEMVDVYSKRPINEKSDVWALGVLLYKLCYYTTPFEEHGPLAILNVQYRIPPYPVYSQEMNMLIGSMLREHGAQRPSVFELLNHVHQLRGTKSRFSYNLPVPPPLVPRVPPHQPKPAPSPNAFSNVTNYAAPSPTIASKSYDYRSLQVSPLPGQGMQARDKVLEAIAPMRRGRPSTSKDSAESTSRQPSPQKAAPRPALAEKSKDWSSANFAAEQDKAWKIATERASTSSAKSLDQNDDVWNVNSGVRLRPKDTGKRPTGFGDDFGERLWNAPDANAVSSQPPPPKLSPRPSPISAKLHAPIRSMAYTGNPSSNNRNTDAFEGLGLMTASNKPAPTLGEARKLRTGLAIMSTPAPEGDYKPTSSIRPSPSPRPNYLSVTPLNPRSISPKTASPTPSSGSWKPSGSPSATSSSIPDGLPPESRFPSLEELDARFKPATNALYPSTVIDATSRFPVQPTKPFETKSQFSSRPIFNANSDSDSNLPKPSLLGNSTSGLRSQQTTGLSGRETKSKFSEQLSSNTSNKSYSSSKAEVTPPATDDTPLWKPTVAKKLPSTFLPNQSTESSSSRLDSPKLSASATLTPPTLPPRPTSTKATPPRDWLTGDDDVREEDVVKRLDLASEQAVLRNSPSKRASLIDHSDFTIPDSSSAQHLFASEPASAEPSSAGLSPTVARFRREFPAVEKLDTREAQKISTRLTDNWSPVAKRESEPEAESSDPDEGPEEPGIPSASGRQKPSRHKARQSSVHDLVNQYGGGLKEKEKERERPPQNIISDYVPYKPRTSTLVPPSKPSFDRKTPSPTSNNFSRSIPAPSRSPHHQQFTGAAEKTTPLDRSPALSKSTSAGRSRPQSMFVFPSKAPEVHSPSPNLLPLLQPAEERRPGRRTSISNMVQRYEAIGGNVATNPAPAPPSPSPVSASFRPFPKSGPVMTGDSDRLHKPAPSVQKHVSTKPSWSSDGPSRLNGAPELTSHFPQDSSSRAFTDMLDRTPTKPTKRPTLETRASPQQEAPTPRPRRISQRVVDSANALAAAAKITNQEIRPSGPSTSPRKPALSITNNPTSMAPSEEAEPSPSPERPYQGVGKLIDQWQKKTAEATKSSAVPPGRRPTYPMKRAGVVNGDDS